MEKCTVRGEISIERLLNTIAMIIERRENVKVTVKIEKIEEPKETA